MVGVPDRTEVLERLRRIVPEKVDVDPALLQANARLADIGIDSFSLIELVFIAEEEFGIRVPLDDLEVKTVGDVLDVIQKCIALNAIRPGLVG
jgi:acyl carrier protein